ncbi:hypothetical protein [Aurantivibrio plasticivorans]
MLTKKSRYRNAKKFSEDTQGNSIFPGVRARSLGPATGVIEHEIVAGDRLDILARHYYNDDRLWWRIVDANPQIHFAQRLLDDSMAGSVILIPKVKE